MPKFSVIISAFNNFEALTRALPFWQSQTCYNFELIVADDGSSEEQVKLFHAAALKTNLAIQHVWHEDQGFDKCGILNKAILVAKAPRFLFVDADMIPRFDLVENHLKLLKPNRFVSGGSHVNLNEEGQTYIESMCSNESGTLFKNNQLVQKGFIPSKKAGRLNHFGFKARIFDFLTFRSNAFSGANSSCWKEDALKVNGFDESWGYGGLDRDFGIRLTNAGVSSRRHQYSLVALHQDHKRPYKDKAKVLENKRQLKTRMNDKISWVDKGISKHRENEIQVIWQKDAERL